VRVYRLVVAIAVLLGFAFDAGAQSNPFFNPPQLVLDIKPGASPSSPSKGVDAGSGGVYFTADDGIHGMELWRTDGTAAGTFLVKDINPGSASSAPALLTRLGNTTTAIFVADDGVHGQRIWKSDGTAAGTVLVFDPSPSYGPPLPSLIASLTAMGPNVYFMECDPNSGCGLWKTDGATAGTSIVKILNFPAVAMPRSLTAVDSTLFFVADDGVHGTELWKSDGTAAGTMLVKDINPTPIQPSPSTVGHSNPDNLIASGGKLFFTADDGTHGRELWVSDGTAAGTALVRELNLGAAGISVVSAADVDGRLFFSISVPGYGNVGLFSTDGTAANTVQIQGMTWAGEMASVAGRLLFAGGGGKELWSVGRDDLQATRLSTIGNPGDPANPMRSFTVAYGQLFFVGEDYSTQYATGQYALWVSDGTASGLPPWKVGTRLVRDFFPGFVASNPTNLLLCTYQRLLFSANDGVHGDELWDLDLFHTLHPPVANAGPDRTVQAGVPIVLDGSASTDPDFDVLSYEWRDAQNNLIGTSPRVSVMFPVGFPLTPLPPFGPGVRYHLTVSDGTFSSQDDVLLGVTDYRDVAITVTGTGGGVGSVNGNVGGFSGWPTCDNTSAPVVTCHFMIQYGTGLTLVAQAQPNSLFTGWSGSLCSGTGPCAFTVTGSLSIGAEFAKAPVHFLLHVSGTDLGSGGIQVSPGASTCANSPGASMDCDYVFTSGTSVTLSAAASPDSAFAGWGPGSSCAGTALTCTLVASSNLSFGGSFLGPRRLDVMPASIESGHGRVVVSPGDFACSVGDPPASCSHTFTPGTTVTLTASADPDSKFLGWDFACAPATGPTCTVTLDGSQQVGARFLGPRYLYLMPAGVESGHGRVVVSPGDFACSVGDPPASCTHTFAPGTTVTVTASADPDSKFLGWDFACAAATGPTCTVTLDGSQEVGARFLGPRHLIVDLVSTESGHGSVLVSPGNMTCSFPHDSSQTPSCDFSFTPGTTVTLTAAAEPDSKFVRWADGCKQTRETPGCSFTMDGSVQVTAEFTIANHPPTASPGGPYTGVRNQSIVFNAVASSDPDGDSLTYVWDFGDGATGSGATPTHAYSALGTFTATVTVNDGKGGSASASTGVIINNQAPTANAGGPYAGVRNQSIAFNAAASSDPDGDALTYTWDFGDGATGSGTTPTHGYATVGTFTATVTVNDGKGGSAKASAGVTINNQAPTASAGGPYSGVRNQSIAFNASASSDPDGDALTYTWDFGDGATGSGPAPTHAYATVGTFTAAVTVSDGKGGSASASAMVTINNQPPTASAGGPYAGVRNQSIAFSAAASSDPDGDTLAYTWAFGDGSTGSGAAPTHAYTTVGAFTATVTVSDGKGGSNSATAGVTITNRSPVANAGPDQMVELGTSFTLNGAASSDPDGDTLSYEWRDGGNNLVGNAASIALSRGLGGFDFTLTVRDGNGGMASDGVHVVVRDSTTPAVTITSPDNAQLLTGVPVTVQWIASDTGGLSAFSLSFSANGGATFSPIAGCQALVGTARSCTWSTPGPVTPAGVIRLIARDASGNTGGDDASVSVATPTISVTAPNSNVTWAVGSSRTISWTSNLGPSATVAIYVSRDDGSTWSTLASSAPNTGSFAWVVAGPTTNSARVWVRWTASPSVWDRSNVNFTIASPAVAMMAPNTNITWSIGSTHTISWSHNLGTGAVMRIDVSRNGGNTWATVASAVPSSNDTTGSYIWTVTGPGTAQARIRVVWTPNTAVTDRSDTNFTIR
jgi:ELWxxDGT repeat protein